MKKALKITAVILILPIFIFILLGVAQGLNQVSYHADPIKAIKSYRIEPPMCFIFFTPPTSTENAKEVLGFYDIDDTHRLYIAYASYIDGEGYTVANVCEVKNQNGIELVRSTDCTAVFDRSRAELEFDGRKINLRIANNSAGTEKYKDSKSIQLKTGKKLILTGI